jgi:hypothetical protein
MTKDVLYKKRRPPGCCRCDGFDRKAGRTLKLVVPEFVWRVVN